VDEVVRRIGRSPICSRPSRNCQLTHSGPLSFRYGWQARSTFWGRFPEMAIIFSSGLPPRNTPNGIPRPRRVCRYSSGNEPITSRCPSSGPMDRLSGGIGQNMKRFPHRRSWPHSRGLLSSPLELWARQLQNCSRQGHSGFRKFPPIDLKFPESTMICRTNLTSARAVPALGRFHLRTFAVSYFRAIRMPELVISIAPAYVRT
jgi:hypothetical protein